MVLACYAALVIPTGLHFWHTYQHALATCGKTGTCGQLGSELLVSNWDSNLNPSQQGGANLVMLLVLLVPFLLGLFVGVPLITREYNEGTNLLIWTRSISRRKWLTVKLVWILAVTALFAGVFAALTTWWSKTGNVLYDNRFGAVKFDMQGIAPVAYAVFAVSLGITLGAWLKRIMAAIGVMLVLLLATQIVVGTLLRPHYMTPLTRHVSIDQNTAGDGRGLSLSPQVPPKSGDAWVVGGKLVSKTGQPLSWTNPPRNCVVTHPDAPVTKSGGRNATTVRAIDSGTGRQADAIISRDGGPSVDFQCLDGLGYHWDTQYQPAYRYWDFQRIETALYIALSAVSLTATYWLVLKRDA